MRRIIPLLFTLLLVSACSSVDCPFNSTVAIKYVLGGEVDTLHDMLTISALRSDGTDTVINSLSNTTYFELPVSYNQPSDKLQFSFTDMTKTTIVDTVTIEKTDIPHFESVDCSPTFFHTIDHVSWTSHAIDSIVITKAQVTNDTSKGHLLLYLKRGH